MAKPKTELGQRRPPPYARWGRRVNPDASALKIRRDSRAQEDVDTPGTQAKASTVDPAKWLAILRKWVPTGPLGVLVVLINSLIETSGPARIDGLDALIAHTDETTRSGREKFERLRQWSNKMRVDPRYWPQLFVRPRAVSILIKAILDKASRPLDRFEVERKFRKFRDVPPSGLGQELKEIAKRGEIDRLAAGLYWRKGTAGKPYESQTQQLYRLVHDAPGHRIPNTELAVAMDISRKDLETLLSQMRKRWRNPRLFEGATGDGVVALPADSLAVLERAGRILDGRGGVFFALGVAPALEEVTWTTLRPDRPRIDPGVLGQKIVWLKTLKGEQRKGAVAATAKELGMDAAALEVSVLSKSELRAARKDAAKEQWRAEVTPLMQKCPERSPLPLPKLFKEVSSRIVGLTKRTFKDVLREQKVWLEQKGLKTSWNAAGAPSRG